MSRPLPISFYEKSNGRCPVQEFLDGLAGETSAKVILQMEIHAELGSHRFPNVKHFEGKVWELISGDLRFFFTTYRQEIIYLHACRKTSNKTKLKDKAAALDRAKEVRE